METQNLQPQLPRKRYTDFWKPGNPRKAHIVDVRKKIAEAPMGKGEKK